MCGIAGFLLRDGARADPAELARMGDALAHRGPDDQGVFVSGPLGLVQTRLSIIGLASGHQPMLSEDRTLALAANGEVYNYLELNADFRARGRTIRTESDSESILHAYALHGLDCARHLRGMFAFALHDATAGRLVLGRDRLGIKPLFYVRLADRIAFASELKALFAILPGRPALDPVGVRRFLQNQFASGEDTAVAGIRRVPPGSLLAVARDLTIQTHRYWSALEVVPRGLSPGEAREELDALFPAVMREHMRSDVPFGLFLSGGTDSAILAEQLATQGAGRIASFSVGFESTREPGELDEAARIAAHFGLDHHPLRLSLDQVVARIPHSVWAADELMRDDASLPTAILAETAAAGLKVVFSGEGGDEAFAGYRRYRPGLPERLIKSLLHPGSGGFRTRGQWSPHWTRRLFGPALAAAAGADQGPFRDAWQATPAGWSDLMRRQYVDLVTALPDNLLVKTDRFLMAFGLEGRVPFLDHRLVELGLSLPDGLEVRGRIGKAILKDWARPRLPAGHLDRPKRGFHVPLGEWLRGETARRVGEALARNRGIREWFRTESIPELVAARAGGRGGGRELFGLMQLAIWHRLFVEDPGSRPAPEEDPLEWIASPD